MVKIGFETDQSMSSASLGTNARSAFKISKSYKRLFDLEHDDDVAKNDASDKESPKSSPKGPRSPKSPPNELVGLNTNSIKLEYNNHECHSISTSSGESGGNAEAAARSEAVSGANQHVNYSNRNA